MPQPMDLTGRTFGKWTVLGRDTTAAGRKWICRCECGVEKSVFYENLHTGHSTRCRSCAGREREARFRSQPETSGKGTRRIDMTGRKLWRWTVLGFSHKDASGHVYWLCRCDCGNESALEGAVLRRGKRQQCSRCAATQRREARRTDNR